MKGKKAERHYAEDDFGKDNSVFRGETIHQQLFAFFSSSNQK